MRLLRFLKRDLGKEISAWVDEGLISDQQGSAISARYGIDAQDDEGPTLAYRVLLGLGFALLGVAVIILLGHNWHEIPRGLRVTGLLLSTLLVNGYALWCFAKDKTGLSTAWFLLGSILYGASIMLVGQIYHLGEHFPDGVFIWALGVLPIALVTGSISIMALCAVLAFTWALVEASVGGFAATFPIFLVGMYGFLRLNKPSLLIALGLVLGMGMYLELATSSLFGASGLWHFGVENLFVAWGYMGLMLAGSAWLETRPRAAAKDYAVLLDVWVLRFAVIMLLVFSYKEPWREVLRANFENPTLFISIMGAIALATTALWLAARAAGARGVVSPVLGWAAAAFSGAIAFNVLEFSPMHLQVLTMLFMVALGIYLIVAGLDRGITHYYFTGVLLILAMAITRYFDLVGDYITASILFAVSALVLIAAAGFWKRKSSQSLEVA